MIRILFFCRAMAEITNQDEVTYDRFTRVLIDGTVINDANYSVAKGSLILTLKADWLDTLAEGDHSVLIEFTDGSVQTVLKIIKQQIPKTGDSSTPLLWLVMMVLGVLVLGIGRRIQAKNDGIESDRCLGLPDRPEISGMAFDLREAIERSTKFMKAYTFPYGGSTGHHDTWDSWADIEISDRDAFRMEKSAKKEPRWGLDEDAEICDIYNRVYKKIVKQNIAELKSIGRWAELVADNPGETDDELLEREMGIWHILFPEELQNLGDD